MTERGARRFLVLILVVFLTLGVIYSVVNPIFESPDESLNYANIRYLIEERNLPVLEPDQPTKAHHPPAYYALGALLTTGVPNENFKAITNRVNAFWIHRVDEPGNDNKNLYLHDPELEAFPYRDVALGVHMLRWLSLLMGAGTVLCVYATTRELVPHRPSIAVMAAALVAFNPMFLFISTSVHDDPLANLVAAAILSATARLLTRGPTLRRVVTLGALSGLALLTKLTCLLIAPTVGLALAWRLYISEERFPWKTLLRLGGTLVLVALLVGGWWLVRNQLIYGEPTSMERQVEAWGGLRADAPNFAAAVRELGFLHDSFWGAFGYGQIPMPDWAYAFPRLLGLLSLGGGILSWARRRPGRISPLAHASDVGQGTLLILLSAPLLTFVVVFLRMALIDTANFGRYLFVSLGFLAPLYTLGLEEWAMEGSSRWVSVAVVIGMVGLATFALFGVLAPAYASPEMLSLREVKGRAEPSELQFGDSIRLVGQKVDEDHVEPGTDVHMTLCWEALEPMEEDYVYFVHLLGGEERVVGARTTHPGLGRYPTTRWSPGNRFCDVLTVRVDQGAPIPAVYDVAIGWHQLGSDGRLPAYGPDGTPLELVLLDRIKVAPKQRASVTVPQKLDANLGAQIQLMGFEAESLQVSPGDTLQLTLYWQARQSLAQDYTVFLHLAARDGPPHAQDDGQPRDGSYPTSFWDAGEVVADTRTLSVPGSLAPGEYPLIAGMYLLETGERLPSLAEDGTVEGDAVLLDTLTILPGDS